MRADVAQRLLSLPLDTPTPIGIGDATYLVPCIAANTFTVTPDLLTGTGMRPVRIPCP